MEVLDTQMKRNLLSSVIIVLLLFNYINTRAQNISAVEKKNIISVNTLNLFNHSLHLGYERLFFDNFGTKLTLLKSFKDEEDNISGGYKVLSNVGIDFNIYPSNKKRKIIFFCGPSIRYGQLRENGSVKRNETEFNYYHKYNYASILFNNGLRVLIGKRLCAELQIGIGKTKITYSKSYNLPPPSFASNNNPNWGIIENKTQLDAFAMLNIGYRF